ncbi:hypothetical protein LNQ03_14920 [Klebsiella pneumoniae subsp. pneumoniae]|nr:hypothetical protein [Klebsiella pneumoniae subsp. pneumoniae]
MGIMIKPTKDRNGTYYIRKAVPQELRPTIGKGELKLSLKTKDLGQAKLKAPAALAEINSNIQNAKAERSVTQDDTEVIASVWMTRILQQPETIKARYVRQYDYGYGLTADNVQLSKCLRKGEQADEADFQLVTQLMQSELEEGSSVDASSTDARMETKSSHGVWRSTGSVRQKCILLMNYLSTPPSTPRNKRKA